MGAPEHDVPDVAAVVHREQDPGRLALSLARRREAVELGVEVVVADDGADALRHQVEVDAAPPLGHALVGDRREPGRDRRRLVVEVRCGEGRAAADLHLQLQGGETVAVPAVDARLAGVEGGQVEALPSGLLEVVPHHRGQKTSAAVVGMDPHRGQAGDRHGAPGTPAVGDGQLHREDAVDAGVGARVESEPTTSAAKRWSSGRKPSSSSIDSSLRVVEPDDLVGGEVTLGVGGALHADLEGVGHVLKETRAPPRVSTGLSARRVSGRTGRADPTPRRSPARARRRTPGGAASG